MPRSQPPAAPLPQLCLCHSRMCENCSLRRTMNSHRRFALMVLATSLATSLALTSLAA